MRLRVSLRGIYLSFLVELGSVLYFVILLHLISNSIAISNSFAEIRHINDPNFNVLAASTGLVCISIVLGELLQYVILVFLLELLDADLRIVLRLILR